MLDRTISIGLAAVLALLLSASAASSCEPVWVRPVDVSAYKSVILGQVEAVNWFLGEVTVDPIRAIVGKPKRVGLHYNNVPFTCASQMFWVGERVYVFDGDWAARPDQVTFEPPGAVPDSGPSQ
jgi:hypothetical protein